MSSAAETKETDCEDLLRPALTGMRITDRIAMPAISEQISFVYVQAMRK